MPQLSLPDMAMEAHMEAATVLFLDTLLDDDHVDAAVLQCSELSTTVLRVRIISSPAALTAVAVQ